MKLLTLILFAVSLGSAATGVTGAASSATSEVLNLMADGLPAGTVGSQVTKNQSISTTDTFAILSEVSGSGYISEIFLSSNKTAIQVIVTIDGEEAIDLTVGQFLGEPYAYNQPAFFGRWISAGASGGGADMGGSFRLPIPFSETAKVEIRNDDAGTASATCYVVYRTGITDSRIIGRTLRAAAVNVGSIAADAETDMLNVSPGKGGTLAGIAWVYDGFPGSASPASAPIEGAFKVYIDGSGTAAYATSGSEDLFGMPWYFNKTNAFGASGSQTMAPSSADNVMTVKTSVTWGAQRFFARDPIEFSSGLRVTWTCGNTGAVSFTGTCLLLGTVYYYQDN